MGMTQREQSIAVPFLIGNNLTEFDINIFSNSRDIIKCQSFGKENDANNNSWTVTLKTAGAKLKMADFSNPHQLQHVYLLFPSLRRSESYGILNPLVPVQILCCLYSLESSAQENFDGYQQERI